MDLDEHCINLYVDDDLLNTIFPKDTINDNFAHFKSEPRSAAVLFRENMQAIVPGGTVALGRRTLG